MNMSNCQSSEAFNFCQQETPTEADTGKTFFPPSTQQIKQLFLHILNTSRRWKASKVRGWCPENSLKSLWGSYLLVCFHYEWYIFRYKLACQFNASRHEPVLLHYVCKPNNQSGMPCSIFSSARQYIVLKTEYWRGVGCDKQSWKR